MIKGRGIIEMGNIVLLDELTINKIAAGEVIERPASVIKEMVENSIDAGATNINIEIRNGGISYIRITDNGKGIPADDMEIAFERHATSKIRSANDLNTVKSMGFRGEALASIAAIANVEMMSRTLEQEIGNRVIVEAGKILTMEETGCPKGTTIVVQNLFFNTPVRYKFLKKDYTESGYIEDAITRLALIHPEIAFKLINTGKTIIQTSGNGKMQDVIYSIYGKDIANAIILVDYTYENMHVTGVVGKPEIARSNRSNQLFFVNKRFVKDKTLTSAAENSFKGLLPIGKYGFLVLNLEMDPAKVDVNVHPAKLEVRFQEENLVFKAIFHAIKETLLKSELVENVKETVETTQSEITPKMQNTITPKNNISDLFRRIVKTNTREKQEGEEKNLIEEIYQKKDQRTDQERQAIENTVAIPTVATPVFEEKVENIIPEGAKMDVFKELLAMQQRLKEETLKNPSLHTNVDQLIQKTQSIGKEKQEYEIVEQEEKIEDSKIEEISQEIPEEIENLVEVGKEELPQEQGEIQELNKEENSILEEQEESKIEKMQEVKQLPEELRQPEEVVREKNESQEMVLQNEQEQEETKNEIEDTKTFSSQEIQEMMDKLNEMDEEQIQSPQFVGMYQKIFGKLPATVEEKKKQEEEKINAYELIKDNNLSVFEQVEEYNKPTYKFIGIAFNTYIIIEIEQDLYLIDQHAAHERIMYEKVKQNYYAEEEKNSQMLLLPDVITLTHKEMDILRDNIEMFDKAGFVLEEFGENTIKLTGVPDICIELDTKELFLETLDQINTVARTAKQEIEEKFIATIACKAAVKAHMVLTVEEVDSLMNDLLELSNPFTCPHGRPTAIKMEKNDIEKKFARRK